MDALGKLNGAFSKRYYRNILTTISSTKKNHKCFPLPNFPTRYSMFSTTSLLNMSLLKSFIFFSLRSCPAQKRLSRIRKSTNKPSKTSSLLRRHMTRRRKRTSSLSKKHDTSTLLSQSRGHSCRPEGRCFRKRKQNPKQWQGKDSKSRDKYS